MPVSSDELNARKRRILFRATHRGMKEMDLLLGALARDVLDELDAAGVAAFERLLEVPDADLLAWASGDDAALEAALLEDEESRALLERLRGYGFVPGSYGENL